MGSSYLGLLLFADNCWIIAMSSGELQTMARAWNEPLKAAGFQIDWGEAVWCSTLQDSHRVGQIYRSSSTRRVFKALGVWITFDGHNTKELACTGVPEAGF